MVEVHTGSKSVSTNSWKQKETSRLLLNTRLSPQVQELHEIKIVKCYENTLKKPHDTFAKFSILFLDIWRQDPRVDETFV